MTKILSIIFILVYSINSFSQDCFVKKKRSIKIINKINTNLYHYSFVDVKEALQDIQKKEGNSAQIFDMYSLIYWMKEDLVKAEEYARKTLSLCPNDFATSNYIIGSLQFEMRNYQISADYLEKSINIGLRERFKERAYEILEKSTVLAKIMRDTVPYNPELVLGISTEEDEYLPLISPDQEIAFFTRRGSRDEFGIVNTKSEDFVKSEGSLEDFDKGEEMDYPFNQNNNEGGATMTIDNSVLYFTVCSKFPSKNCDIYYVIKGDYGGWSDLIPLKSVNSPTSWESQPTISADGNSLIFASNRKGGFGGVDLYIVHKDTFGYWGAPQNMGGVINSVLDDKSPFLHVDGQTMYFASQQFPSLGGYDIFVSRLGEDDNWQIPENVGFPINTEDDELGMFVTTDGKRAYFCSNKLEGIGGWDLYSFDLHQKVKPKRVLFLKGNITDSDGVIVDSVSLELQNVSTNEVTQISVKGGKYVSALTLEDSDDVLITFNKEGYSFNSHYISSTNEDFSGPSNIDIKIDKVENGHTFEINNVYFDTDSFNLNRVTKIILTSFVEYLKRNESLELLIAGHTDNVGSNKDNLILSNNRAQSVYTFLIESGISDDRLTYKGYGEEIPAYDNSTKEGRSKNRRTECTVINK